MDGIICDPYKKEIEGDATYTHIQERKVMKMEADRNNVGLNQMIAGSHQKLKDT